MSELSAAQRLLISPVSVATVAGAAVTTLDASGLDGNRDKQYTMRGRIRNATGGAIDLSMRINGAATNQNNVQHYYGAAHGNQGPTAGSLFSTLVAAAELQFVMHLPRTATGFWRQVILEFLQSDGAGACEVGGTMGLIWLNTADNIVSLGFASSVASGIAIGSELSVSVY